MTLDELTQLIEQQERCPESLPPALQALWYDKKGNWNKAHQIVQNASDTDSAWVHAYLHRKEGDLRMLITGTDALDSQSLRVIFPKNGSISLGICS